MQAMRSNENSDVICSAKWDELKMPVKDKKYLNIVSHYESCLDKHGDSHLGVDWPNREDAETRYRVMLEVIREDRSGRITLLDFGCGASHLYDFILRNKFDNIEYSGLDLSEKFIHLSKRKYPSINYYCMDILDDQAALPEFDYIMMNGVFTEKRDLCFDDMFAYFQSVVSRVFIKARKGIAFNVMSKHVDWEREDLFHLSFDRLASFLVKDVSRNLVIRQDYGLYEYTVYVYRQPCPSREI